MQKKQLAYDQKLIFKEELQLIIKSVLDFDVNEIVLYGGYGRNEGSIIINDDGECKPYNDFDILLIVDSKIEVQQIKKMSLSNSDTWKW